MAANLRSSSAVARSRLLHSPSSTWSLLSGPCSPPFYSHARPLETLAYEEVGSSEEGRNTCTALVLHGLLGAARNWRTFSRRLASELKNRHPSDDWRMVLLDLRNHGNSTGIKFDPPHDMSNSARDVANLVKSQGWAWPDVVIAHSMGGKVALQYAASCACGDYGDSAILPKQLWVLDSIPGEVKKDFSDGEVEKILHILQNLPSSFPTRKWVVDHMLGLGFSRATADWIASNLKKDGNNWVWVFDLEGAIEMFNSYRATSYWSLVEHVPKGMEIAIVQGENSDRWTDDSIQRVKSLSRQEKRPDEGKLSFHVLPKSGHWVHADNPKGLLEIMVPNFYSKGSC